MEGVRKTMIRATRFSMGRFKHIKPEDDEKFHKAVDFLKSHPVNPNSSIAARKLFYGRPSDNSDGGKNFECAAKKFVSDMIQIHVVYAQYFLTYYEVNGVVSQFRRLHRKLEVTPSSSAYQKLIVYCCDSREVHMALDLVKEMIDLGLPFSLDTLHYILEASSEEFDYFLVYQIFSLMNRCNLKPNSETFRVMLDLCLKVKNYDGTFSLLCHLEKNDMLPTAAMYYAVMRRYYQEMGELYMLFQHKGRLRKCWIQRLLKNLSHQSENLGEMKEADIESDNLGEMKEADIEPDDQTRDYQENMSCRLEILEEKKEVDVKLDDQNCDDPENMSRQLEILKEKKEADIKLDDQNCDDQERHELENLEEKNEADVKLDDDQTCNDQEYVSRLLEIMKKADIQPDDQTCDSLLRNY